VGRGPNGYPDMNISMDMNTIIFSWIISADISVLLKFHEYEYRFALNIHGYSECYNCFYSCLTVASGADIHSRYLGRYYHFVGSLSIEKWANNGFLLVKPLPPRVPPKPFCWSCLASSADRSMDP
jgi:hypothetical protein